MEANSSSNPGGVNISTPLTTDSAINTSDGNGKDGKGGKVSKVWEHCTKFGNGTKCKCNYCSKVYTYHSRFIETHTLWNHLCDSGSQNQSANAVIFPSELEKRSAIVDYRLAKNDLDFDIIRLIFITLLLVGVEQWFRETLFLTLLLAGVEQWFRETLPMHGI
ncbi:hypothetical protein WN944_004203 [Citrus x changshan-huyou]|uniref:BED-type domain-containing protein n=1 Tax=Citrus x changshan-huyou TaxID=2935761 RepID=A0AAP0M1F3_9ROSI